MTPALNTVVVLSLLLIGAECWIILLYDELSMLRHNAREAKR